MGGAGVGWLGHSRWLGSTVAECFEHGQEGKEWKKGLGLYASMRFSNCFDYSIRTGGIEPIKETMGNSG